MRHQLKTYALSAMICAFAGAAFAQSAAPAETQQQRPRANTDSSAAVSPPSAAAAAADAPNARVAGLINSTGAIIRNKGIQSVTRIATGVYCVQPTTASGVRPGTAIVTVTPEYYYSLLTEVKVQWAANRSGCGVGKFGIYTFADANADGIYTYSNSVAFSIVVP